MKYIVGLATLERLAQQGEIVAFVRVCCSMQLNVDGLRTCFHGAPEKDRNNAHRAFQAICAYVLSSIEAVAAAFAAEARAQQLEARAQQLEARAQQLDLQQIRDEFYRQLAQSRSEAGADAAEQQSV